MIKLYPSYPPVPTIEMWKHLPYHNLHNTWLVSLYLNIVSEVSYLYLTYDVGCTVYINDIDHKLMNVRCPSVALIWSMNILHSNL